MNSQRPFGVQREIPALEIPLGTSPIFDKFSPAPPEPTLVNEIRQTTTDQQPRLQTLKSSTEQAMEAAAAEESLEASASRIREVLEDAIDDGRITVEKRSGSAPYRHTDRGERVVSLWLCRAHLGV
ncbi:MAG: hypothetical protein MH208_11735 [Marinobacter sp.]|nr:hypothetical protein [Marinobacter sp.]